MPERYSFGGQMATLIIAQSEPATAKLLLQDAILLEQLVDGRGLFALDPAGDGSEQQPAGLESQHDGGDRTVRAHRRRSSALRAFEFPDTTGAIARSFGGASPVARALQFLGEIEPVLPASTAAWNGRATLDTWHDNPLTGCSYSFWKVGKYTQLSGVEGEPEGNAFFCGEHTSQDAQGYMEGAVETGERAAREVTAALSGR